MKVALFALIVTVAAAAQVTQRVYTFTNVTTPVGLQEVTNIFRAVGDTKDVLPDITRHTVTVNADATGLGIFDWLAPLLDVTSGTGAQQFQVPGNADDVIAVIYAPGAASPVAMQELVNVARTAADINRVFPVNGPKAIVARGASERIALAKWCATELLALSAPSPAEFLLTQDIPQYPAKRIHVYRLNTATSPIAIQETVNTLRTTAEVNRVFPFNQTHAIVARGNDEQIALSDWLVSALDKTPPGSGVASQHIQLATPYPMPGSEERVFYLPPTTTPAALQQVVNNIRQDVGINRVFPANIPVAITVRGNADQVARAEEIVTSTQR